MVFLEKNGAVREEVGEAPPQNTQGNASVLLSSPQPILRSQVGLGLLERILGPIIPSPGHWD